VQRLRADGVAILGPGSGDQACGEVGMGRMLEALELHAAILAALQPKLLAGVRVLVTAGPTFEAIDPVRGLTNRSSGRMGYALAQAALEAGAQVTLVSGPTTLTPPVGARVVPVTSAQDMLQAVNAEIAATDVFVAVAAVADYRAKHSSAQKIKKNDRPLTLELEPTVDILASVSTRPAPPFCVGFAAESHDLAKHAKAKRERKGIPLLVGNIGPLTFGQDDNQMLLVDAAGATELPRASKIECARRLVAEIAQRLPARRT
jgi:phosphopantothenoylcysteine decarboxylase/phosphopantothenate--cysteine ligase